MSVNKTKTEKIIEEVMVDTQMESRQETGIQSKSNIVIYIGPTIPDIATTGMVFNNGIPEKLKDACNGYPFFNGLIVPIEKLALAQEDLKMENTPTNLFYKKAVEFSQKRGE